MIEIKGLSKKYRSKYVVKDVTTEFPDGKITCCLLYTSDAADELLTV